MGEFLLVLAYPGSPVPTAVKRLCVCVYVPVAHGDAAVAHIWACFYLAVFAKMTLMYLFSAVHVQLVLKALAASRRR